MKLLTEFILFAIFCMTLVACQGKSEVDVLQTPPQIVAGHGGAPVRVDDAHPKNINNATVAILKGMKLEDYPAITIGEAFDRYSHFTIKEWKETRMPNMKIYIDFTGTQKTGAFDLGPRKETYSQGIIVKFVINSDGSFNVAMASKVRFMSDGKMYSVPVEDKNRILEAIYSNKEINL